MNRTRRILVSGASGYIGGLLVPELLACGHPVRVMVRAPSPEYAERWPEAEIAAADALDKDSLYHALLGVDTACYLIHSLLLGPKEFETADITAAANFRDAAALAGVKRIIYLGGLGDVRASLSAHLRSRMRVGEELSLGTVPVTILRAAIIIGSGSASYEIIEHLVRNLPVHLIPRWAKNRCQPIAVRDVIKYLMGVLAKEETAGKSYDIGGSDVLTYEGMLKKAASIHRKKILFLPSPLRSTRFFGYVAGLFTPVPAAIAQSLMHGLKNEVICQNDTIRKVLPFRTLSYTQALVDAMTREQQDRIASRWSDAYPPAHELAISLDEIGDTPHYISSYSLRTDKSPERLFRSVSSIGGKTGWFHTNWMWRMRGMVDKIFAGVGTARGRRSHSSLRINDVIDFWRVEDLVRERSLLLRAEMKLPGKAWLHFTISPEAGCNRLTVTAHFCADGVLGRIYWYAFLPFHSIIFKDLITEIEKKS